jgi:hypothetical protein
MCRIDNWSAEHRLGVLRTWVAILALREFRRPAKRRGGGTTAKTRFLYGLPIATPTTILL